MPYTLDQLRTAHQAAQAAGDQRSAQTIWQALVQQRTAEDNAAGQNSYDPTEGMSTVDKLRAGIGQGMSNVARHAGNLVGLVSDSDLQDADQRDAALLNTGAGKVGSFVGEMAAIPVPMAGATGALAKVGGKLGASLVGGAVRRGATEGAIQGAIMADPGERTQGALTGGAVGGVLPGLFRAGQKVAHGVTRTPEAQALLDRGVDLTPGQMNPHGMINQLEESWQSVPFVGPVIGGARDNARRKYQQAVVREGAAPGAAIPDGDIDQMLDAAYKSFEPLYDQAKGFPMRPHVMTNTGTDKPLATLFKQIVDSKSIPATDDARKRAADILRNELTTGIGSSDDMLSMRSNVRAASRKARKSPESLQQDTADILDAAEKQITAALESQLPKDALSALRTADSKYGSYKIIEDAVAAAKDQTGGFSPAQLSTAVKGATNKSAYARGAGGPLRDMASQGRETLDVRSPPTGQRLAAIGIPGLTGIANPALGVPAGAAFFGMVGTQAGRKLAGGSTAAQKRLAQALQRVQQIPGPTRGVSERYARALLAAGTN